MYTLLIKRKGELTWQLGKYADRDTVAAEREWYTKHTNLVVKVVKGRATR